MIKTAVVGQQIHIFANLYDLSQISISRLIKNLKDKGYIEVEISYIDGTNGIDKRYIQICKEGINKMIILLLTKMLRRIIQVLIIQV